MPPEKPIDQPLEKWEAESVRVTTIFRPNVDVGDAKLWWPKLIGKEPDEEVSRPGMRQLQQVGSFEGKSLVLSGQPGRVDWALLPTVPAPDDVTDLLQSIGPFSDAVKVISTIAEKWFLICPPVARLAFGALLNQSAADVKSAYTQMVKYLRSVKVDAEGSSDLFYQINRPRVSTSGVSGLTINRLSKWSVIGIGRLAIAVGSQGSRASSSGALHFACRLELDINTSADFPDELSKDKLSPILQELTDLGREISEGGDIA